MELIRKLRNTYLRVERSFSLLKLNAYCSVAKTKYNKMDMPNRDMKCVMINLYTRVRSILNNDTCVINYAYRRRHSEWICVASVEWPYRREFISGLCQTKTSSCQEASAQLYQWLLELNKIDETGRLRTHSHKGHLLSSKVKNVEIEINAEHLTRVKDLLSFYNENIKMLHDVVHPIPSIREMIDGRSFLPLVPDNNEDYANRNEHLYKLLEKRQQMDTLPADGHREEIVSIVKNNRVTIVQGDTGSGKSTRIPQMILDDFIKDFNGTSCNTIVVQPRRISAVSLANRVASERGEKIGDSIGYHVRLNHAFPSGLGSIMYVTTGIMLQKLQSDPGLSTSSHVILDEVHEREINMDMLLLFLKKALESNENLKLIVMSATIDSWLFQNYFDGAPLIKIPGCAYDVQSYFLDAALAGEYNFKNFGDNRLNPVVPYEALVSIIKNLHFTRPPGSILCFVPGWGDISILREKLSRECYAKELHVLAAHSKLTCEEQELIFLNAPEGKRKVILATNIAESSLTIPDVVYVVDTGIAKETNWDSRDEAMKLENKWISQANVKQRKGRAGRVQAGECYHMYSKEQFGALPKYPTSAIRRISLSSVILNAKVYSEDLACDFLSQLIEPPNRTAIMDAVDDLIRLGILDENEKLTPLGKRVVFFITSPRQSKALAASVAFGCYSSALSIITFLSSDTDIFKKRTVDNASLRNTKMKFNRFSDHLSILRIYNTWANFYKDGGALAELFCQLHHLNHDKLILFQKLRNSFSDTVRTSCLIDSEYLYDDPENAWNTFCSDDEIVKGVLLFGVGNLITKKHRIYSSGKEEEVLITENSVHVHFGSGSVNYHSDRFPTPFILSFDSTKSAERRAILVNESSFMSPLEVLLFHYSHFVIAPHPRKDNFSIITAHGKNSKLFTIECATETATMIMDLRNVILSLMDYTMNTQGCVSDETSHEKCMNFRDKLCTLLSDLLKDSAKKCGIIT